MEGRIYLLVMLDLKSKLYHFYPSQSHQQLNQLFFHSTLIIDEYVGGEFSGQIYILGS